MSDPYVESILEAMARAVCRAAWDNENSWKDYVPHCRAALLAALEKMRDEDEGMLNAGARAVPASLADIAYRAMIDNLRQRAGA